MITGNFLVKKNSLVSSIKSLMFFLVSVKMGLESKVMGFSLSQKGVYPVMKDSTEIVVTEAATGGVLYEKVFLEISQNSQENTCARVSF